MRGLARLIEPYGEFSPMGVAWYFIGVSTAYTIFSGMMEVVGGALLIIRRTATLGALFSCTVLTNVVLLNFCYDIPVKLYSSNLLLMAIFLAAADTPRLLNVFVRNRPAPPSTLDGPLFTRRWMRIAAVLLQRSAIASGCM